MSHSNAEKVPDVMEAGQRWRAVDSLALMLLSSFLNEFFVWWSFMGSMSWQSWPAIPNLPIFLLLWLCGAHVLFLVWVAFLLFRGRLQVPLEVIGVFVIAAFLSGCAIQSGFFRSGVLATIGPALFFFLHLLGATSLIKERRYDLGIQILLSATMGLVSGLLYIYLYLSSI